MGVDIKKSKDKGWIISLDKISTPKGLKVSECINDKDGVIYWDSKFGGSAPQIIHLGGDKFKEREHYKIVDLAK